MAMMMPDFARSSAKKVLTFSSDLQRAVLDVCLTWQDESLKVASWAPDFSRCLVREVGQVQSQSNITVVQIAGDVHFLEEMDQALQIANKEHFPHPTDQSRVC